MSRKFEIKIAVTPPTGRRYWMRIGHATETEGEYGPMILCTMVTKPLNWNGEFFLFPVRPKGKKKDEYPANEPPGFDDYE